MPVTFSGVEMDFQYLSPSETTIITKLSYTHSQIFLFICGNVFKQNTKFKNYDSASLPPQINIHGSYSWSK